MSHDGNDVQWKYFIGSIYFFGGNGIASFIVGYQYHTSVEVDGIDKNETYTRYPQSTKKKIYYYLPFQNGVLDFYLLTCEMRSTDRYFCIEAWLEQNIVIQ